jgi:hypothetical protein
MSRKQLVKLKTKIKKEKTKRRRVTTLVESHLPPIPTSIMATST